MGTRKFLTLMCALSFLTPAFAADNVVTKAPATMQKFAVRYVADDIDPASFGAQPRVCYRAGETYGRVEEAVDEPLGLHGLIIIAAPDVWMINLADSTGKHMLDQGTTEAAMPILASGQAAFKTLEFGRELSFYTNKNIRPEEGPVVDGAPTQSYKYSDSSIDTELLVNQEKQPVKLVISTPHGKRTLLYSGYATLPFDASKFAKPDDVAISELDFKSESAKVEAVREAAEKIAEEAGTASEDDKTSHYGSESAGSLREPAGPLKALNESKDLWQWMTYYYLFPVPDLTVSGMQLIEKEGALDKEGALPPISSFLSRVFLQNPDKIHQWVNEVKISEAHKKAVLPLVLRLTRLPAAIAEAETIEKDMPSKDRIVTHMDLSPEKLETFYVSAPSDLDMLWGCFLATGDKRYVQKIISTVPWSKKITGSINKISIGAAAVWSLTSNAQQHKLVLQILKEECENKPELQSDLNKIIKKATAE